MVFVATLSPATHQFESAVALPPPKAHTRMTRANQPMVEQPWWHGNPAKSPVPQGTDSTDSFDVTGSTVPTACRLGVDNARRPRGGAPSRRYNSASDIRREEPPAVTERTKMAQVQLPQQRPPASLRPTSSITSAQSSPRRPSQPSLPHTLSAKSRTVSEPLLDQFFQVKGWRKPAPSDWQHSTQGHTALAAETLIEPNAIPPPSDTQSPTQNETAGPYIILKTLGSGAFSHVKLAVHARDGIRVAIKMLEKPTTSSSASAAATTNMLSEQARNEASLLDSINHPNIVRLLNTFETETHSCLVLEYVPNSDLYELITNHPQSLTPQFVRRIFRELCSAVGYLHARNIAHRDLKIENILVDSEAGVKLTDFGLAQQFDPAIPLTTRCGSEEYAAPELIQALPYDGRKIDVWALGIILFTLLTNEMPFTHRPGERPRRMFHRIARGDYHFPETVPGKRAISDQARDLVKKMLTTNPQKRISIEAVLKHPYLTGETVEKGHPPLPSDGQR
ncbi:kinase-like domain-containing protein [Powellomyces hirtus]|nr:kinase-like domain-containing protein [Powellomyces hirtus]